jgi:hypothetical protein
MAMQLFSAFTEFAQSESAISSQYLHWLRQRAPFRKHHRKKNSINAVKTGKAAWMHGACTTYIF